MYYNDKGRSLDKGRHRFSVNGAADITCRREQFMQHVTQPSCKEQSTDLFSLFVFFQWQTPTDSNEEIVTSLWKTDSHLWKSMSLNEPGTRLKDALQQNTIDKCKHSPVFDYVNYCYLSLSYISRCWRLKKMLFFFVVVFF